MSDLLKNAGRKIGEYRKSIKQNQTAFWSKFDVINTLGSLYENSLRPVPIEIVVMICGYYKIPLSDFLDFPKNLITQNERQIYFDSSEKAIQVDYYGKVTAGELVEMHDKSIGKSFYLDKELYGISSNSILPDNLPRFILLTIMGESMENFGIYDGDVILIDRNCKFDKSVIHNLDIAIVQNKNSEMTLKEIIFSDDAYILNPGNISHFPKAIKRSDAEFCGVYYSTVMHKHRRRESPKKIIKGLKF